jgi:hypothetical protein
LTPATIAIQEAAFGADAQQVLAEVVRLCASCRQPLAADCLVNYRRQAWQDDDGELRLTIDTGLSFFAPPADLWQRRKALVRESLGPAVATEARRVLEIKTRGPAPSWLRDPPGPARACADRVQQVRGGLGCGPWLTAADDAGSASRRPGS